MILLFLLLWFFFQGEKVAHVHCRIDSKSFPGQTTRDHFVTYPVAHHVVFDPSKMNLDIPIFHYHNSTTYRGVRYHYVRLENPLGHLHVITAGDRGCPGIMKTSETSHLLSCKVATNAGFFNMQTGDCIGNVISRGHLAHLSGLRNINFGITLSGQYVIGYLTKDTIQELGFRELIAGVIWLVAEGKPFWDLSDAIEGPDFMDILAPRTMLGHDRFGRVILVVVEGTETVDEQQQHDKRVASGVTIAELGQLALSLGLYNAINLDGGGSSAFVLNGKVMNEITEQCPDDPSKICERLVTTIMCIK